MNFGIANTTGAAIARAAVGKHWRGHRLAAEVGWRGVAASAAGAAVVQVVGNAINGVDFRLGQFGNALASGTLRGLAAGATAAAARGGKVAIQQVAIDAFGNAIGESLAAQSSSGYSEAAFSAQEDARDAAMSQLLGKV